MTYYSSTQTDKYLQELEKKITTIYREANAELTQEAAAYFAKFKTRYQNEYEAYQRGTYTKSEFDAWVKSQVLRGQHWATLRNNAAERITNANKIAAAYINDTTPSIYTLNFNYEGYRAENEVVGISFDICDEQTVKRLIKDNPNVLPTLPQTKAVNVPKDRLWNQQKLTQSVASAIIQGKSISKLADSFQNVTNMNRVSAIRNARTAFTSAQNGGRQESYNSLADMGVNVQKRWVATLDGATRESHMRVDGEVVDYKDTFSNGLEYPADPSGPPAEVYNCRCTMEAVFDENKNSTRTRRARNEYGENEIVTNMTYKGKDGTSSYESWVNGKSQQGSTWNLSLQFFGRRASSLPTVQLGRAEYARVMSSLTSNLANEERNHKTVTKAIGDFTYVFEKMDENEYRVIGKTEIPNAITGILERVYDE